MNELKSTGTLLKVDDTVQISDSFKKREFVITTDGEYPQTVKFELTQNKCEKLDGYKVGDHITVSFNLRGRVWTNKEGKDVYFNSLQAWRLEKEHVSAPSGGAELPDDNEDSGLPF